MQDAICSSPINNSMLVRIGLTLFSMFLLYTQKNTNIIGNNLYILLPVLLSFLDTTDNLFTRSLKYKGSFNGCTKTFDYQSKDKIVDVLSYFLSFGLFGDTNVLLLSIFRAIGIALFYFTKTSYWLIFFFDFVKEYMFYVYLFKDNFKYLPLAIIAKIVFEYYFHSFVNKQTY
jgi:hypothetical protein